jgi:hypothetical protein
MSLTVSQLYIPFAIAALAIIGIIFFWINPATKSLKLSFMAALSFGFVLAGILFGEERWIGYGLIGTGVLLAVVDIIRNYGRKRPFE